MTVFYLEPTKEFPTGLVITGGNDNVILIYKPGEPFAYLTLKEHTNAGILVFLPMSIRCCLHIFNLQCLV